MEVEKEKNTSISQVEVRASDQEPQKQGKDKGAPSAGGHRKSLSGSLSQFSFFRSSSTGDHGSPTVNHGGRPASPGSPILDPSPSPRAAGGAMAAAVQQRSMRKRKGSLRKTALLGTGGKSRMDGKDRRGSSGLEEAQHVEDDQGDGFATDSSTLSAPLSPVSSPVDIPTPRPLPIPPPVPMVTHPIHGDPSKISASSTTTATITQQSSSRAFFRPPWPLGGLGLTPSSTSTIQTTSTAQSTASTTSDEGESPISDMPRRGHAESNARVSDSYFPPQAPAVASQQQTTARLFSRSPSTLSASSAASAAAAAAIRPLTAPKLRSPLAAIPPTSSSIPTTTASASALATQPPNEWDYSETRWWGWFILTVTWIVFVVGMGSCFEVWSWAWDVGETPYAPKELEDDPTLPIVGYYPALMVLTAVMAWVWVVVAWVGMKYFKHANIIGED